MRAAHAGLIAAGNTGAGTVTQYVQIRGSNSAVSNTTNLSTSQPAGIAAGDLGIFTYRESGATTTNDPSTNQAWTADGTLPSGIHKLYGSSEAAPSVTLSTAVDLVETLLVLSNVNQSQPLDITPQRSTFSSGTSFAGSTLTSTSARTFLVSVLIYNPSTQTTAATITPPSGYTMIGPAASATNKLQVKIAYKTSPDAALATSGATVSSPTWTASIAAFSCQIVNYLIRPSS